MSEELSRTVWKTEAQNLFWNIASPCNKLLNQTQVHSGNGIWSWNLTTGSLVRCTFYISMLACLTICLCPLICWPLWVTAVTAMRLPLHQVLAQIHLFTNALLGCPMQKKTSDPLSFLPSPPLLTFLPCFCYHTHLMCFFRVNSFTVQALSCSGLCSWVLPLLLYPGFYGPLYHKKCSYF